MSSHHFVKEGQWPINCFFETDLEVVCNTRDLLDWTSSIWTDQKSFLLLDQNSINIDQVLYFDEGFLKESSNLIDRNKPLNCLQVLDNQFFEKVFEASKKCGVNILSSKSPFEFSHVLEKIIVYLPSTQVKWFTSNQVFTFYNSSNSKWYEKGELIEVFCLKDKIEVQGDVALSGSFSEIKVEVLKNGLVYFQTNNPYCVIESFC